MAGNNFLQNRVTSGGTLKIFQNSGFSSSILQSITPGSTHYGVAMDNNGNIMFSDANPATKILRGTGFSATVTSSFSVSFGNIVYDMHWMYNGINDLMISDATSKVRRYTGFSSTVGASYTFGENVRGVSADATTYYFALIGTPKAIHTTGFNTTVGSSFTQATNHLVNCAYDGTNYLSQADDGTATNHVRQFSGFSSTITASFTQADYSNSIGCDWQPSSSSAVIKTWDGVAQASVKTYIAVTTANTKTWDGLANQ